MFIGVCPWAGRGDPGCDTMWSAAVALLLGVPVADRALGALRKR